jgi:hypothetical protein
MVKPNEYVTPIRTGILVEGCLDTETSFQLDLESGRFRLDFLYPRTSIRNTAIFSIIDSKIMHHYALVKISGKYYKGKGRIEEIQLDLPRQYVSRVISHLKTYREMLEDSDNPWEEEGPTRSFYKMMAEEVEKAIHEKFQIPRGKVIPFRKKK